MSNPRYEVVSPLGRPPTEGGRTKSAAPPLASLAGKRIGLFWNGFTNGNLLLEALAELLKKRCGDIDFVKLKSGRGLEWGTYPDRSLTEVARESGIHAAIAGPGC